MHAGVCLTLANVLTVVATMPVKAAYMSCWQCSSSASIDVGGHVCTGGLHYLCGPGVDILDGDYVSHFCVCQVPSIAAHPFAISVSNDVPDMLRIAHAYSNAAQFGLTHHSLPQQDRLYTIFAPKTLHENGIRIYQFLPNSMVSHDQTLITAATQAV